jgi:hypothetical protein
MSKNQTDYAKFGFKSDSIHAYLMMAIPILIEEGFKTQE